MLTCLRIFLEDLLIQFVAFPFRVLILYSKFTQSCFVFINKIRFLELKIFRNIWPKYWKLAEDIVLFLKLLIRLVKQKLNLH